MESLLSFGWLPLLVNSHTIVFLISYWQYSDQQHYNSNGVH